MFEKELLELFRRLSPARQKHIISFLRGFVGSVSQKTKKEVKAYEGKQ